MYHQCIINVSMCITNVSDVSPMYQQCIIYVHLCTFSAHFKHIHTLFSVTKLIIICKIRILSDNMQLVREHPKTRNKIIGMHTHKNIWQNFHKISGRFHLIHRWNHLILLLNSFLYPLS